MEIATTFTTDPKNVLRSYRACHPAGVAVHSVLAVALVLLGIFEQSIAQVVFGIFVFAFGEISLRRQLKPYVQGPRTVTVTMTEDEYRTQGPDRATSRTWTRLAPYCRVLAAAAGPGSTQSGRRDQAEVVRRMGHVGR